MPNPDSLAQRRSSRIPRSASARNIAGNSDIRSLVYLPTHLPPSPHYIREHAPVPHIRRAFTTAGCTRPSSLFFVFVVVVSHLTTANWHTAFTGLAADIPGGKDRSQGHGLLPV
ncbi:hypothetical protein F4776DRAFT_665627 [Hypoxylon sp. NC0597]|nr:hypothetical protein F4776DRAFT_665627 [Hypoxylon sp. NC0597]